MVDGDNQSESTRRSSRLLWGTVIALLVTHFVLANAATWNKCSTFDETPHIGNGLSFWATGDYRMAPEAILQQRWISLPIYLGNYQFPVTSDEEFEGENLTPAELQQKKLQVFAWRNSDNWSYSQQLCYFLGNDPQRMLHQARMMTTVWSVILALLTFCWARSLFGVQAGLIALVLYVFNPNLLAHGSSASIDVAAALAFTASMWTLWRVIHVVSPVSVLASCVVVGCALVTKHSLLLVVPMGLLLAVIRLAGRRPLVLQFGKFQREVQNVFAQGAVLLGLVLAHVLVAWCIIWVIFGCRYEMFRDGSEGHTIYTGEWHHQVNDAEGKPVDIGVLGQIQMPAKPGGPPRNRLAVTFVEYCRDHHVLPEAYLYTFANTLKTTAGRSAFLDGQYAVFGFPLFFPKCFLYKTPVAAFCLLAFAALAVAFRWRAQAGTVAIQWLKAFWQGFVATAPLWCLLIVYWYTSISSGINIGLRHILPTFPATFILASAAGAWLVRRGGDSASQADSARPRSHQPQRRPLFSRNGESIWVALGRGVMKLAVAGSVIAYIGVALSAFPNYLAYFNSIAGGSENGYKHLVDSSLDWGQELPNLKRWLDDHELSPPRSTEKVYLSYFGTARPHLIGLNPLWLPCFFDWIRHEPLAPPPTPPATLSPGVYCISASMLQCVYLMPYAGRWRKDYEDDYQQLVKLAAIIESAGQDPKRVSALLEKSGDRQLVAWMVQRQVGNIPQALALHDAARFGRLAAYLRQTKTPEASINHAILIYRVSEVDLRLALSPQLPPVEAFAAPKRPGYPVPE